MTKKNLKNLTPFGKGQSGNLAGRPKGSRNASTILKKMLEELAPTEIVNARFVAEFCRGKKRMTNADAIAARLLYLGIVTGELAAIKEILDRTEGKPLQKQQVTGADGQPLVTTFLIQPNNSLKDHD